MEHGSGSPQALLRQGVAWLKTRQKILVENLADSMAMQKELPEHRLPSFIRKLVAKDMIQDLIKRLDENTFDAESARKKMVSALKKGATLQSISMTMDLMLTVISTEVNRELAASPAIRDILLNKAHYFTTLLKSTLATAAIENEKSKMS